MKSLITLILFVGATLSAQAVQMNVVSCWKGFNQTQQNQNEAACNKSKTELQICSTNWNEHKGAVYDVCLMQAAANPTVVVQVFKGYRQSEQNQNLAQCRKLQSFGTLCISDWSIHKQAVYDVALMQ